jgi:hypothetical protein
MDIEQYWGIFEIKTAITEDATIEQMKIHTNRAEINGDGKLEFFGLARYPRTLQTGLTGVVTNALANPSNENVDYSSNFRAIYTDNEFQAGASDGFGIVQGIESGMDTSIPLQVILSYYVKGGGTGDIKFQIDVHQVNDGFVYDGSDIPETFTKIVNIPGGANKVRKSTTVLIDAHTLTDSGDALLISIQRKGGDAEDTLGNNVIMTNVTVKAHFWGP